MKKTAIIVGAGPAGLTAAFELLTHTDITPIIIEKEAIPGGISKTVNYKGNRMDMGPHRFFSKSDRVMDWWLSQFPLATNAGDAPTISYQQQHRTIHSTTETTPADPDKVLLVIPRLTRIYFLRKFFAYPIKLSFDTLRTLGLFRTVQIIYSYLYARLFPRNPEKSLEDFIINKFGTALYELFFRDYTEKVWGLPCREISAEWGAQRIKGVSLSKAVAHAVRSLSKKGGNDLGQKDTETSLIEQFLYPKLGAGQLWEHIANQVEQQGGTIVYNQDVKEILTEKGQVTGIRTINRQNGTTSLFEGDYFISTMPVQELIAGMEAAPSEIKQIAAGLQYRDFINVGVLLKRLSTKDRKTGIHKTIDLKDSWIYIQEREVKLGRLQIYNNWGGGMVSDPDNTWLGLEYFCNKDDAFWRQTDEEIKRVAIDELVSIDLAHPNDVLDVTVQRMEKTYPAYFGTYERFSEVRQFLDGFPNLFLIGRNGMHKYNNTDHSMLTAMVAVDNIKAGITSKANLWNINTEQEYHEEKQAETSQEEQTASNSAVPFPDFVLKRHRVTVFFAALVSLIQFIGFKILYPFANFIPDSRSYILAAARNASINQWPIGYSKFLRLFSTFFQGDTQLAAFQYAAMQAAALYFLLSLFYHLKPNREVRFVLLVFFLLNPAILVMSNFVTADSLFIALSFIWIGQLLWLIYRPSTGIYYAHALVLFLCFIIRLNALVYPLFSLLVIFYSKYPLATKIKATTLTLLLVGLFIWHTGNQYKTLTGQRQLSAFGGWQLAANGLTAVRFTDTKTDKVPARFQQISGITRHYFDSLKTVETRPDADFNIHYLWNGPLIQYQQLKYPKEKAGEAFKHYATLAPFYKDYGSWLIKSDPANFWNYYLWPNMKRYFIPPAEFLGEYNMKKDSVSNEVKAWFGYKQNKVRAFSKELGFMKVYPMMNGITTIMVFGMAICFLAWKTYRQNPALSTASKLILGFTIVNLLFSILASAIVLRYQLFPMMITVSIGALLMQELLKEEPKTVPEKGTLEHRIVQAF